jgi:hypothetical protein
MMEDTLHYLMLLVARFYIEYRKSVLVYRIHSGQFYAERPLLGGKRVKITVELEDDVPEVV